MIEHFSSKNTSAAISVSSLYVTTCRLDFFFGNLTMTKVVYYQGVFEFRHTSIAIVGVRAKKRLKTSLVFFSTIESSLREMRTFSATIRLTRV